MKKKLSAIVLAGMMACLSFGSLVGCENRAKKRIQDFVMPDGGFDTTKQVEITFYHSMGQSKQAILEENIAEFNKLFPNIKINANVHKFGKYDDIRDTIMTEINAGTQPSLAYCYPDHVAMYNEAGAVLPLNDFLPNGKFKDITVNLADGTTQPVGYTKEQTDAFFENYYNEGFLFGNGKTMYTVPFAKSTELLYYNKTFFDANNLKVPTTWDEMEALCKKIKEGDDETEALDSACTAPLGYDSEANWFITMCEQYNSPYTSATGKKYRFNNATNRAFVTRFKGWFDKEYVMTMALNGNAYTSKLFTDKKTYMCIGSSAGASNQMPKQVDDTREFEVGIAPIPQVDPEHPKAISQGPSVCIFKDSDPQKVLASWLFAKYLTTNVDFQAQFSFDSGYAPVIKTATENEIYQRLLAKADGYNYLVQLAVKTCMANSEACFTSPAFVGSSKARDQVGSLMASVFSGKKDVNTAFKNAVTECEHFAR